MIQRTCICCDRQIETARLEALPYTDFCIACAKKVNIPRQRSMVSFVPDEEPIDQEIAFD